MKIKNLLAVLLLIAGGGISANAQPLVFQPDQAGDITHNSIVLRWTGSSAVLVDWCRGSTTDTPATTTCVNRLDISSRVASGFRVPDDVTAAVRSRVTLQPETTYCYRLFDSSSVVSNIKCYTTTAAPTPSITLTASENAMGEVVLDFSNRVNVGTLAFLRISRTDGLGARSGFTTLQTFTDFTTATYTDTTTTPGMPYTYLLSWRSDGAAQDEDVYADITTAAPSITPPPTLTLQVAVAADRSGVELTATRTGYTSQAGDETFIFRCDGRVECQQVNANQIAFGIVDDVSELANPYIDTTADLTATYTYVWQDQFAATYTATAIYPPPASSTTTIDEAILPKVITGITGGINQSIQQRIEQRRKEKGN